MLQGLSNSTVRFPVTMASSLKKMHKPGGFHTIAIKDSGCPVSHCFSSSPTINLINCLCLLHPTTFSSNKPTLVHHLIHLINKAPLNNHQNAILGPHRRCLRSSSLCPIFLHIHPSSLQRKRTIPHPNKLQRRRNRHASRLHLPASRRCCSNISTRSRHHPTNRRHLPSRSQHRSEHSPIR